MPHTFSLPLVPIKKKREEEDGCSVLHALADLHNAIPPPAPLGTSKQVRPLANRCTHRLRAVYCCWIIQELAEWKRQGEWGVCTLSPGETEAKAGASLEEWVTAARSLETPAEDKHRKTTARNPYCLSLLYLSPIRDTVNSTLLNAAASFHHKPFIITCHNIPTSLSLHKRRCIDWLIMRVSSLNRQSRKGCVCWGKNLDSLNFEVMCVLAVEGGETHRVSRTLWWIWKHCSAMLTSTGNHLLPVNASPARLSRLQGNKGWGGEGIRRGYGLWREGPSLGTDWRRGGDWWERGRWVNDALCWWKQGDSSGLYCTTQYTYALGTSSV